MLYPDLAARTCGFIGVFLALILLGLMNTPDFLITPQPSYAPLEMHISVRSVQEENVQSASAEARTESTPKGEAESKSAAQPQRAPESPESPESSESLPVATSKETPQEVEQTQESSQNTSSTQSSQLQVQPQAAVKNEQAPQAQVKPQEAPSQPKTQPKQEQEKKLKQEQKLKERSQERQKVLRTPAKTQQQKTASAETKAQRAAQATKASTAKPAPTQNTYNEQISTQRVQSHISNLLVQEIKRKLRYPRNAIRRKLEGVVQVEFSIKQGKISTFRLSKSSGHKILDDAAKKLAQGMLNMRLPVNEHDAVVIVPIKYELL